MLTGERIKSRRLEMQLSLTRLAKAAGTSQGYLSDLENGKVDSPTSTIVVRLADVLETSADFLMGRTDNPVPIPAATPNEFAEVVRTGSAFGEKLRQARTLRQMTLAQLSAATKDVDPSGKGLAMSYICDIEMGRCISPGDKNVELLAKALHLPGTWFIDSKSAIPHEALAHLSQDLLQWLSRLDTLPYVRVAKRLDESGVSLKTIEVFIELIETERQKTKGA